MRLSSVTRFITFSLTDNVNMKHSTEVTKKGVCDFDKKENQMFVCGIFQYITVTVYSILYVTYSVTLQMK